jgi:HAD superfamily hydrolase (TIGR01509 family)
LIKAILWDNDGVLVDTERLYFQATREILARAGVDLTQEMFVEYSLKKGKSVWYLAAEKGSSPDEVSLMRDERNARYSQLLSEEDTVIEGVAETLPKLHQFAMGIVTTSRREHFDIIHRASGLLQYFAFVLTREDYEKSKPDPEPYLRGLEKTGVERSECIVIEDSKRGLTAATRAGLRCLVIPTALNRDDDFSEAYMVLDAITDVTPELLRSI